MTVSRLENPAADSAVRGRVPAVAAAIYLALGAALSFSLGWSLPAFFIFSLLALLNLAALTLVSQALMRYMGEPNRAPWEVSLWALVKLTVFLGMLLALFMVSRAGNLSSASERAPSVALAAALGLGALVMVPLSVGAWKEFKRYAWP